MTDDDDLRDLFPPIVPLDAMPGTYGRITQTVVRRRRFRYAAGAATAIVLFSVVALGTHVFLVGVGRNPAAPAGPIGSASVPPASVTSTLGTPSPTGPEATVSEPTCRATSLHMSLMPGTIAENDGSIGLVIVVTNTGAGACVVNGYPSVSLFDSPDAGAAAWPTTTTAGRTRAWIDPGTAVIRLAAGQSASAGMEFAAPGSTAQCSPPVVVKIKLPAVSGELSADLPGMGCVGSTIHTTAMVGGDSGPA